ncbi:M20 metallopeptidase family protein [Aquirufa aurantiipilula]|uniref:M20 family metallopeptidase n=1 Tax=Aquirufa aurantiipilula TaxID=2696561 RepID=A0ABT6BK08_9BACT|nr:M20 family metallopeptidase [Aquirufa aurantiipilula]MDF5690663.1 M20 family metallopeptidase [Aquirufa aurantiipilula]
MSSLLKKIQELAEQQANANIDTRRHLHAHPELSFHEFKTQVYVESQLNKLGIPTQRIANTGVIAIIEGKNPTKKVVALRADMDALPIQETNDIPYKSQNPGVMHACGHDVHTSSLLGTARILQSVKDEFEGTIKLLFQPAEEKAPGGASIMIQEGALQNPSPAGILGQHVATNIPVGKVGFREGMYMASADELYLTVKGKGGHGAMPDQCIDPIVIASHIIIAMQQIISRNKNPRLPSVLSFGKFIAEGATNVIPNEVKIEGTFRAMDEEWRADGLAKMKKLAEGIAESMGGSCDFFVLKGYPFLKNNPELTRRMKEAAVEYMGADNVIDLDIWMAAEDFAFYTHHVDACFYRLGTRNDDKGIIHGVHTPNFNIDEKALHVGPGLMAWLAIQELSLA